MHLHRSALSPLLFSGLLLGCNSPIKIDGQESGGCVDNGCDAGLVCADMVCVDPSSTVGGTGRDTDGFDASSEDGIEPDTGGGVPSASSVSILVVLDNSGSMGEEQARFAPAVGELATTLATAGIDWRIGVTTTDNGNPWCTGTTPEAGSLRLSSCRSRLEEFVFNGANTVDATETACMSQCTHNQIEVTPSAAFDGGATQPRPWIEYLGGSSNVANGVSIEDALTCAMPQGVNGCGFEQPLESMYKAILRSDAVDDNMYGFVPPDALLVVLLVTDEVDCSYNDESIFLPDGARTFWSLPDEPAPTSAVCWNAGVACAGGMCQSVDLNEFGESTNPDSGVLRPVSRYVDKLAEAESAMVVLLGGSDSSGGVLYADSPDQDFVDNFGIGPGCENGENSAVPPVRQREVAEAHPLDGGQSLFSVCDASYGRAMDSLGEAIIGRLQP